MIGVGCDRTLLGGPCGCTKRCSKFIPTCCASTPVRACPKCQALMARHHEAVHLAKHVGDPEDRETLLAYVVFGSEDVDRALGRRKRQRGRAPEGAL